MKNIDKLELVLLPLIIIAIIVLIGGIGTLFYAIWFFLSIHWIFKLLISILVIYFLYFGYVMGDIRTENQIEFYNEQLKKLKEEKYK